jgi:LacI family transcriptional regulator
MSGTDRPRRVTSREVAERAGVSRATVSFVLNGVRANRVSDATRQRVLRVARELGYVPDAAARSLVSGRAGTIGLLVNHAQHLGVDSFINQALHSLTEMCGDRGYRLLIETSDLTRGACADAGLAEARRIDGLVVINPNPDDARLAELIERHYPMVLLGNHPDPRVATISVNSHAAMEAATRHITARGHRRVGFIHYREIASVDEGGRFGGYRAALHAAGLPFEARIVRSGDYSAESGYRAMRSLLTEPDRPTAVMIGNDTVAIGAISAIVDAGLRVPGDVAVVGFDDIPLARFVVPALTTIRLPAEEMARRAGDMVVRLVEGEALAEHRVRLPTELIVRRSCGWGGSNQ